MLPFIVILLIVICVVVMCFLIASEISSENLFIFTSLGLIFYILSILAHCYNAKVVLLKDDARLVTENGAVWVLDKDYGNHNANDTFKKNIDPEKQKVSFIMYQSLFYYGETRLRLEDREIENKSESEPESTKIE